MHLYLIIFSSPFCCRFLFIFRMDSSLLWMRIDPDMQWPASIDFKQPDFMWQYMAQYDRDVVGQATVGMGYLFLELLFYGLIG